MTVGRLITTAAVLVACAAGCGTGDHRSVSPCKIPADGAKWRLVGPAGPAWIDSTAAADSLDSGGWEGVCVLSSSRTMTRPAQLRALRRAGDRGATGGARE
jgi:hypothetical protein